MLADRAAQVEKQLSVAEEELQSERVVRSRLQADATLERSQIAALTVRAACTQA